MAKQAGPVFIEGTIDDLTFYQVEGEWYVRGKSSLTGKRVKQDPKFRRTMQSAERLKRGSQLASSVYRTLPRGLQVYALFRELKSIAIRALKEGKSEAAVVLLLERTVRPKKAVIAPGDRKKSGLAKTPSRVAFTQPLLRSVGYGKGSLLRNRLRASILTPKGTRKRMTIGKRECG